MLLAWAALAIAICFEVAASLSLKYASDGRLWAYLVAVLGYTTSFGLMIVALKRLEISTTYAIWAGVGTAMIAALGIAFLGESINAIKIVSIALIIIGVVGLNLAGTH